jgi:hypothetical protein
VFKGYSVVLPFNYNKEDGPYALNKTLLDVVKQNLKTLILTDRGERIMLPDFGVGLKRFLFNNLNQTTSLEIRSEVETQVRKYLPFVQIEEVNVYEDPSNLNKITVGISFYIPAISTRDYLLLEG